jgi:hypothetical protein
MHRVQSGEVCKIFSLGMMDHGTDHIVTMCLHETYNPARIDKHSYSEWPETRECSI